MKAIIFMQQPLSFSKSLCKKVQRMMRLNVTNPSVSTAQSLTEYLFHPRICSNTSCIFCNRYNTDGYVTTALRAYAVEFSACVWYTTGAVFILYA